METPEPGLCFELYQRPTGVVADEVVDIVRPLTGKWFTHDVLESVGKDLQFQDLLCLRRDGVMVSFIMFTSLDGAIHLSIVGTHPDHQGQGLGSMLMQRLFQHARRIGYQRVVALTVPPEAKEAYGPTVHFYQKHGFEIKARYSDLWQSGAIELMAEI
jgi:ribosomal protein S18 acetylase RimI-like enzyme